MKNVFRAMLGMDIVKLEAVHMQILEVHNFSVFLVKKSHIWQ